MLHSCYNNRDEKDGEITGVIVEKHINGLEINLECVIISFSHGFQLRPLVDINALRFVSGINIDIRPQQILNTSNP